MVEATYSVPVITHVCLETHGLTAHWDSDKSITAWASTQTVNGVSPANWPGHFQHPRRRT